MELLASWKAKGDNRYYSPISIDLFYSPPMMRTFLWEDEVGDVYHFSMNLPIFEAESPDGEAVDPTSGQPL